jgi:hypothetical protein
MAFGKDPRLALIGGSFRQTATTLGRELVTYGPKGRLPYYVDKYEPNLMTPDTVRLVPANCLQHRAVGEGEKAEIVDVVTTYYEFTEHYMPSVKKSCICSAGPFSRIKSRRSPCRGCDIFYATATRDAKNRLESNIIHLQDKYVFCVLDYGAHHKIEQIDKETAQYKINPTTNQPFFNWVKCQGQGCTACQQSKELRYGNMTHWPMSYTHRQILMQAELNIGQSCAVCSNTDFAGASPIKSLAWNCRNCGSVVIDMATSSMKLDEILKMTAKPFQCNDCNEVRFLEERIRCVECEKLGQAGARAGLFDVDMRIQLIDTGMKAKLLQVQGWSPPRAITAPFDEMAKPIDLVTRYSPDSMEYQLARFGNTDYSTTRAPVQGAAPTGQSFSHYNKPS